MPEIRLFGIRHHGPGSARSLQAAPDAFRPDCLLIEGPPDADGLIELVAHAEMAPPVALLVYRPDRPQTCAFFPFAGFSPEWLAMRHGIAAGAIVRFIDPPQAIQFADGFGAPREGAEAEEAAPDPLAEGAETLLKDGPCPVPAAIRRDPLGELAEAAGYPDGERWWDALIESRTGTDGDVFVAIADAMAALREKAEPNPDEAFREEVREAHMRAAIRKAGKEFERVAVVCGAWHVPALARYDARGQSGVDDAPMALIRRRLVIGERLGATPPDSPGTPAEADFAVQCKRLRLKPGGDAGEIMLDLRKDTGLARSHFLNRLQLLGIPWGERRQTRGRGTFKEAWFIAWKPEWVVELVAASAQGGTVAGAAAARVRALAHAATRVAELSGLIGTLLDAELARASTDVIRALKDRAAVSADVFDLMEAVPAASS